LGRLSDTELRARRREAESQPDDEGAARTWLAAAERMGDVASATAALAHLARLGDVAAYDRLASMPAWAWPRWNGFGGTHRVRTSDLAFAGRVIETGFVGGSPPLVLFSDWSQRYAEDFEGTRLWTIGPAIPATIGTTGFVALEGERTYGPGKKADRVEGPLRLRSVRTGEVIAEKALPGCFTGMSAEFDRAVLAPESGGLFCVDLDPARFGRVLWDRRPRSSAVRDYVPGDTFALGDELRHPKFGAGKIVKVQATQIVVAFENGEKTLKQNAGRPARVVAGDPIDVGFRSFMLVGSALLVDWSGDLVVLDANTGRDRFKLDGELEICAADEYGIVTDHSRSTARGGEGHITELDPHTGAERYVFPGKAVDFVALGKRLLLAKRIKQRRGRSDDEEMVALDRTKKGALVWRMPVHHVRCVSEAHVVCTVDRSGRGPLVIFDLDTGDLLPEARA